MDTLFGEMDAPAKPLQEVSANAPLAARMRPQTLSDVIGQDSLLGPGGVLRTAIESDNLLSLILWGPPGCGKTTLARIIARTTRSAYETFSAVTSGIPELRKVMERAQDRMRATRQRTVLFVDEIHRWNKSQQDALLPHVEEGSIVLIGATTENPYFEVNSALLSRAKVFRLEPLTEEAILTLLNRALEDSERGLGKQGVKAEPDALLHLARTCGGDARWALGALEAAVHLAAAQGTSDPVITKTIAEQAAQQRMLSYDKDGDNHYDTVSAFIKSMRGSDPDAAVYWLARMITAGEDPRFIARRLVILASEDIGNADPQALILAQAAAQAAMFVGFPEAQLILSQATLYLASAPKSNASMKALGRAQEDIRVKGPAPVPLPLRDAHYPSAKTLGHGEGYLYPHDYPGGFVEQEYVPAEFKSCTYYEPTNNGYESKIREHLASLHKNPESNSTPDNDEDPF